MFVTVTGGSVAVLSAQTSCCHEAIAQLCPGPDVRVKPRETHNTKDVFIGSS